MERKLLREAAYALDYEGIDESLVSEIRKTLAADQCVEAADRMEKLVAVRNAAQALMDYFERSLGAGPLTNNPGKEGALINLLRAALKATGQ